MIEVAKEKKMASNSTSSILGNKWDLKTQTPHGGQEWSDLPNFVEDFSVTTNALNAPFKALHMSMHSAMYIHHYPPSNYQPALNLLCCFLLGIEEDKKEKEDVITEENNFCCFCYNKNNSICKNNSKCLLYNKTYLNYVNQFDYLEKNGEEKNEEKCYFKFTEEKKKEFLSLKNRLLLGNGASELIDLVIRFCDYDLTKQNKLKKRKSNVNYEIKVIEEEEEKTILRNGTNNESNNNICHDNYCNNEDKIMNNSVSGSKEVYEDEEVQHLFRTGPFSVQYKEYERCAINQNRKRASAYDKNAKLLCIVNPCNPTGEFMNVEEMKKFIAENCTNDTYVVVDESMLPWYGPKWLTQSLISQSEWIAELSQTKQIKIFLIHSWTKLWACPGLRIGSLIAPTEDDAKFLKINKTPWSLNTLAVSFLSEVVLDKEYLNRTWKVTKEWRKEQIEKIEKIHSSWKFYGENWLSYIWIDTENDKVAEFYALKCKQNGVPIRWGTFGYEKNSFIRLAVREPKYFEILLDILKIPYNDA